MGKKRKQRVVLNITRQDIYDYETMECPVCHGQVSTFRLKQCILNESFKHKDFMGQCPICRK